MTHRGGSPGIRACLTKDRLGFGCDGGVHDRHDLSDEQWALLEPLLPVERTGGPGRPWTPHRRVVNAILWRTRTGSPWRDLPAAYGSWQTVYGRHRTWSGDGTWDRVLRGLQRGSDGDDPEWVVSVDSTSVRAHHHAAGAPRAAPIDVSAERLEVAFADAHLEVVEPADGVTGGSIELQGSAV
jgi:transposase